MAVLGSNNLTFADKIKMMGPGQDIIHAAEVLDQSNEILSHAALVEGNLITGARNSVDLSLPSIYTKTYNKGTPASKATTTQMDETTTLYDAWSEVDEDLAQLGGNVKQTRFTQAKKILEAMSQQAASDLFYANEATDPSKFTGFAQRYSDPASTAYKAHMIKGTAGSFQMDCTSIWLVGWSPDTVALLYPKGTMGGIQRKDFGLDATKDSDGNSLSMYRERFKWHFGLTVKDWRYVSRFHSIDASVHDGDYDFTSLLQGIVKMTHRVPTHRGGINWRLYGTRSVGEWLHLESLDKRNNTVTQKNVNGEPLTMVSGVPFHETDAISHNEMSLN